ncbi:MAG: BatD family protein [Marinifilaceae bacterium]
MKRLLVLFLSTLLFTAYAKADEVNFSASAPNVVEVGEQFRLAFSVNKKGKNLILPKLIDFDILMGPSTSSSMSTQYINGKMTSSSSYTYTYVLMAKKEGKYTIDPAKITVDGTVHSSKPITIEVVKADPAKSKRQRSGSNQATASKITQDNLFVKVSVDRNSVYMGEHVVATIKVYTRLQIAGFGDSKFPSFDGFLSQEIKQPNQISLQRENVNGTIYNTGIIRKLILFPQHTGEITIDPFELECVVRQRRKARSQSFFDDFFDSYQDVRVPRRSKPVKIKVKALPNNAPNSFHGAVGQFKMTTTLDKDSMKTNDAITMKVKISGNGNLKLIDPLKFNFPADFEVYDPEVKQQLKNSARGTSGSTTFKYLIIPRHAGDFDIDPIFFTYFDPKSKSYKVKRTKRFKIHVDKGEEDVAGQVVTTLTKEDVKFIGRDIRYIKTNDFTPQLKGEVFFGTLNFYLAYLGPLALFVLLFLFNQKRIRENADLAKVKNKRANRMAMKRLKGASQSLKAQKKEEFYDEILKALWGYTSDKLNLPLADLNKENISELLIGKGVARELIDQFMEILNTCEFARYAPASGSSEMDRIYEETMETITKLDKSIK